MLDVDIITDDEELEKLLLHLNVDAEEQQQLLLLQEDVEEEQQVLRLLEDAEEKAQQLPEEDIANINQNQSYLYCLNCRIQ